MVEVLSNAAQVVSEDLWQLLRRRRTERADEVVHLVVGELQARRREDAARREAGLPKAWRKLRRPRVHERRAEESDHEQHDMRYRTRDLTRGSVPCLGPACGSV